MQEQFEDAWAEVRAERVWRWANFYSWLHNVLSLFYWVLALAVPFGLAIMPYLPQDRYRNPLSIGLLFASGVSLVLQVTVTAMRFKERANRGKTAVNKLEEYILKRHAGIINAESFMDGVDEFLKETSQEEGP